MSRSPDRQGLQVPRRPDCLTPDCGPGGLAGSCLLRFANQLPIALPDRLDFLQEFRHHAPVFRVPASPANCIMHRLRELFIATLAVKMVGEALEAEAHALERNLRVLPSRLRSSETYELIRRHNVPATVIRCPDNTTNVLDGTNLIDSARRLRVTLLDLDILICPIHGHRHVSLPSRVRRSCVADELDEPPLGSLPFVPDCRPLRHVKRPSRGLGDPSPLSSNANSCTHSHRNSRLWRSAPPIAAAEYVTQRFTPSAASSRCSRNPPSPSASCAASTHSKLWVVANTCTLNCSADSGDGLPDVREHGVVKPVLDFVDEHHPVRRRSRSASTMRARCVMPAPRAGKRNELAQADVRPYHRGAARCVVLDRLQSGFESA